MVIACDTSFLFSLYGSDVHSATAVAWVAKNTHTILLNSLTHFELGNALRFAEFREVIPVGVSNRYWSGFEAAIDQGRLTVVTSNLADVVNEARRLSSVHTLEGGHRSFDILHVASAISMEATHFLTFDRNQKKLAEDEGMEVPI